MDTGYNYNARYGNGYYYGGDGDEQPSVEDAIIVRKKLSFWEKYGKWIIWAAVVVFSVIVVCIVVYVVKNKIKNNVNVTETFIVGDTKWTSEADYADQYINSLLNLDTP